MADDTVRMAAAWERLLAEVIDEVLKFLLFVVGWVILTVVLARRGATPGKRLVGVRIIGRDGEPASVRTVLVRELVYKLLLGVVTFGVSMVIGAVQVAWDRRPWWDRVGGTTVVR